MFLEISHVKKSFGQGDSRTEVLKGVALSLSIALCFVLDLIAGPGISDPSVGSKNLAEVPLRCAGYVIFYQIPAWLLYEGSRYLARNIQKEREG